jgi:small subunit ribosomal protein S17
MSTKPAADSSKTPDPGALDTVERNTERAQRKVMRGTVVSTKMQKTVVVQVDRKVRHPLYEKFVSRRTRLYAHDEKNEAKVGDVVDVTHTRPLSKMKCWRLVRIVQKASV